MRFARWLAGGWLAFALLLAAAFVTSRNWTGAAIVAVFGVVVPTRWWEAVRPDLRAEPVRPGDPGQGNQAWSPHLTGTDDGQRWRP